MFNLNFSSSTAPRYLQPLLGATLLISAVAATAAPATNGEEKGNGGPMGRMKEMRTAMPDRSDRPDGLAVTVLGSGGPMAMTDRASSGYVIYINRVPHMLIDGGGGTFERLGEDRIFDLLRLDTWLFSHLHIDHSAEFPAIIKSMYFLRRGYNINTPITVIGPDAWGDFPSTSQFVDAFFDPEKGVYRYLHAFVHTVMGGNLSFETKNLPYDYEKTTEPVQVFDRDGVRVTSIPVMHGPREAQTPAVAFRIDYGGHSITYSGDLNSRSGNLVKLAKGTDMLIYDAALGPVQNFEPPDLYHTPPGDIGKAAQSAGVKTLVLTHFMAPYLPVKVERIVSAVKEQYKGKVIVASDMTTLGANGATASTAGADDSQEEASDARQRGGPMERMRNRFRE